MNEIMADTNLGCFTIQRHHFIIIHVLNSYHSPIILVVLLATPTRDRIIRRIPTSTSRVPDLPGNVRIDYETSRIEETSKSTTNEHGRNSIECANGRIACARITRC